MTHETIAKTLAQARKTGTKLAKYPGRTPETMDEAFAIQHLVTRHLGWRQRGWKIGCTSAAALKALEADEPFPGPVYAERLYETGAEVPTSDSALRLVEPEIAFTMARDLAPRGADRSVDEVLAAAASVHPALENVNRRAPGGFLDGVTWHFADGGLNDALVLGPGHPPLPREAYAKITVEAFVNGAPKTTGSGAEALGGPEIALVWLANYLNRHGLTLNAGDIVTTGVISGLFAVEHGDEVEARYATLGTVSARYVAQA